MRQVVPLFLTGWRTKQLLDRAFNVTNIEKNEIVDVYHKYISIFRFINMWE